MATRGSNRDVRLTLSIDTLGEDGIQALEQSVRDLAAQGGAAAPEFGALADEISRLGQQAGALGTFRELSDETAELAARQEQANSRLQEMQGALQQTSQAASQAAERMQSAKDAVAAGQKAYNEATNAIRLLRTEYDAAGKKTDEYKSRMAALLVAQTEAKNALVDLRNEQREATAAVGEADREQANLEKSLARSQKAADAAADALTKHEQALRESAQAANELGVATDNIAQSEAELLTAFNAAGAAVQRRKTSIEEMAEADRLLAIEERSLATLYERGAQALQAEEQAQRDAARAVQAYADAKQQAASDAATWQREADGIVAAAEAARELARQTEINVTAQRELAAASAFEKQAAEAQRMVQAAAYVRFWTEALDQAEEQARQTAAAAAESAQRIDNAFSTLGVQSVEALEQEIRQVRAAMDVVADQARATGQSMSGAFAAGEARIKQLELEIRKLNGTLTAGDRAASLFKNSLGQIAAGNLIADGIGYLVNKVKEMGAAFVTSLIDLERMRRGLTAIYKDTAVTAQQIEYLRAVARASGVAVGDLQGNFIKFSAAMHMANVPIAESNALFAAVARSAGTLGLSGEQVAGMLEALGQMASKGTVSMEELRQQLGDRLPGALGLAAKGLGITAAELIKLIESGSLATRDFVAPFTQALSELQGEVSGLGPTWENLKTALTGTAQAAGDAGWTQLLIVGLRALSAVLGVVVITLQGFSEGLFIAGKAVVAFFGALKGDREAFTWFSEELVKSRDRLTETTQMFYDLATGAKTALPAVQQNAEAQKAQAAAMDQTIKAASDLNIQIGKTAEGQAALKLAQEGAADGTKNLSAQYIQLDTRLQATVSELNKKQEAADKEAKAIKIQGDSLVELNRLRGDEQALLGASAASAEAHRAALEKSNALRQAEVEVLVVQRDELIRMATLQDGNIEARRTEIAELSKKITLAAAEAEQSKAAVAAAEQEVAARQLAAKTYEDNAKMVDVYKASMEQARRTLDAVVIAEKMGLATAEDVTKARQREAEATALYKDALNDSVAAIDRKMRLDTAALQVAQTSANAEVQRYAAMERTARARGDEVTATYAAIEGKKAEIAALEISIKIRELEIAAARQSIEVKIAELDPADKLYQQKKQELEIQLKLLEAKKLENDARKAGIQDLQNEVNNLRNGTNETDKNSDAKKKNADATRDQAAATRELTAAEAERKRLNVDKDGFSLDKSGNRLAMGGDLNTRTGILNFLKSAGVDDDREAQRIMREFTDGRGNVPYVNNPGQMKYGDYGDTLSAALLKAAESYRFDSNRAGRVASGGTAASPSADTSTTKSVNINIGGASSRINVNSDADVKNLTSILRQLESASSTSA